jgi:zinc transport system permease protein
MNEFFQAIGNYEFMRNALLACILAGLGGGIVGTYVVTRRITYIGGGIAHAILGGMGVAYYLSVINEWGWLHPLYGAAITAVILSVFIGWASLKAGQREDTLISALWAIGMAVGIIFIYKTPGYYENLMSYLFGNILMISSGDLLMIAILDIIIILAALLFYRQFMAICFDEEFARTRGINVGFYYVFLLILTALMVVIMITLVGVVMVIALLTIPAAISSRFTRTIGQTMFFASAIAIILTIAGLAISYLTDTPTGAVIILIMGSVYFLSFLLVRIFPTLSR